MIKKILQTMSDYKLNTEEWQENWLLELNTKDMFLVQNHIPFWIRMWTLESEAYILNTGLLIDKLFNIDNSLYFTTLFEKWEQS